MSAQSKLLAYLQAHVGEDLDRKTLTEIAQTLDWPRSIRTLRQLGWQIDTLKDGYRLNSLEKKDSKKERGTINSKLRYAVFHRDNSTCQRCGKTPQDGAKLQADHKIPVEWGGGTGIDNLWTLCSECNGGKKHYFADLDSEVMAKVMSKQSGTERLTTFFELNPDLEIETNTLAIISNIRDWTRTLRNIRNKKGLNIEYVNPSGKFPNGAYINKTNN